jgi:hypothetical protein
MIPGNEIGEKAKRESESRHHVWCQPHGKSLCQRGPDRIQQIIEVGGVSGGVLVSCNILYSVLRQDAGVGRLLDPNMFQSLVERIFVFNVALLSEGGLAVKESVKDG